MVAPEILEREAEPLWENFKLLSYACLIYKIIFDCSRVKNQYPVFSKKFIDLLRAMTNGIYVNCRLAQTPVDRSPVRLTFARCYLIFVGRQYENCFMSSSGV
jgi:hypothetical protein